MSDETGKRFTTYRYVPIIQIIVLAERPVVVSLSCRPSIPPSLIRACHVNALGYSY
jgi:hypothetical protein